MITLIVLAASAVSPIKHIMNVVGIRKTATEVVASTKKDLCRETSEKLSESTVPAHNCGDSAAQSKSVERHKPESPANSNKDSTSHREEMRTRYFTKDICTFAGGFNNLWIIPTLQAILKLTVIQDKLQQQAPAALIKHSNTPKFASLFLKALKNPGKQFNDIYEALLDLRTILPNSNEPKTLFCFLDHVLVWFEKCGLHTTVIKTKTITCESCKFSNSYKSNLGRIIELPLPLSPNQSTYSLLKSTFSKSHWIQKCAICKTNIEGQVVWNALDILILHLPEDSGSQPRQPVAASEFVTIYISKDQKTVYTLSSIICYSSAQQRYRAFLINIFVTIKSDQHLSVIRGRPQETLDGKIYLYERVYARHWSKALRQELAATSK